MNVKIPLRYGLAAAMLSLLFSGAAQAACGSSERIEKDDAECLAGGYTNRSGFNHDTAWVRNECSDYGTVVAKVDRAGTTDWTIWLNQYNDSISVRSGLLGNIRGIYCCSDLGICNKADFISTDTCMNEYWQSPAANIGNWFPYPEADCVGSTVSATADASAGTCTISGWCHVADGTGGTTYIQASITASFDEVSEILSCNLGFCMP